MRIFVTGGTGFIGRHVVQELDSQSHELLLLSRHPKDALSSLTTPTVDMVQGDLLNTDNWRDAVESFAPQVAIHLAWEDLPNYDARTSLKNLNCGLNLITVLAETDCQSVICAGSCWEYGQQNGILHEDMNPQPYNAFTAAKNALHWTGREVAKENGMHFIWARLFYVYGPGRKTKSLIPQVINHVRKGEAPEVKAPQNRNDFIYVADVARAIATIVRKTQNDGVYNIGSGYSTG
ncbi:NAD-dependent epimerase/dehydratase family protein, partial [Chloroflexota bacterium]